MNEFQVESLIEAYMRDKGASGVAYNSIIGGGDNATILHYVENNMPLKDGDLILIDAGAEYEGYASDITRTFPVNGKYSKAQREIYDVVLDVQHSVSRHKDRQHRQGRQEFSIELLTEGMKKLGLLKGKTKDLIKKKSYMKYYMHGVGHYLGLDVHDAGRYFTDQTAKNSRPFAPGMVLTVEPGLYIPPDDKSAPAKYRGIGVRIEDDVLVTKDGNLNLTAKVPKDPDEIEAMMAQRVGGSGPLSKEKYLMNLSVKNLPALFAALLVSILFIQSGLDKVFDWKGNFEWLTGHFSKTFLGGMVPICSRRSPLWNWRPDSLAAAGIVYFFAGGSIILIFYASVIGAASITALFFGQRVAKDYPGAAVLVPYFILLVLLIYLTNPFVRL